MDHQIDRAQSSAPIGTFSMHEYETNTDRVVAHAAATGSAVVVADDGRPLVYISILTKDLPEIDD